MLTASLCGFGTQDCGMLAAHPLGSSLHVISEDYLGTKKGGEPMHEMNVYDTR